MTHSTSGRVIKPFLRWPGGKTWLLERIQQECTAGRHARLIEPFLGGGALSLNAQIPVLASDVIPDLIETWECVRDDPNGLVKRVWAYGRGKDAFLKVRSSSPRSKMGRAARFLYLNRLCWGGVYRVNQMGEFNTPYGSDAERVIIRRQWLTAAAAALAHATFALSDFEDVVAQAQAGDFVFADPPYVMPSKTGESGFRRYSRDVFDRSDLARLLDSLSSASVRGATVFLCLGWRDDARFVQDLVRAHNLSVVGTWRRSSARATIGSAFTEVLITAQPAPTAPAAKLIAAAGVPSSRMRL